MPILEFCRKAQAPLSRAEPDAARGPAARRGAAGFTLVEMLVVLAILGLLAALAFPALTRAYDRARFAFGRDSIERAIDLLPLRAYGEARRLVLDYANGAPPAEPVPETVRLPLPEGWRARTEEPIVYTETGVCLGGALSLALGQETYTYALDPPRCRPRLSPGR
jgi:prepilin-type N-terminal cleavage/methylation domain-containing protein